VTAAASGQVETFAAPGGPRLAYRQLGSGAPLLCQPGGPGRAAAYLEDLAGLSASRTLVLLDARGTGGSEAPSDPFAYAPSDLAGDVDALREHLGLERVDLLGHSAGARVALEYAASRPERVRRLVLVTPPFMMSADDVAAARDEVVSARSGEAWYAEAADAREAMDYAPAGEKVRLERMLRPFWYGRWGEREQEHAASAETQQNRRVASRFSAAGAAAEQAGGADRLAAVSAPTLVIGGGRDGLTPPLCAEKVAAALPRARLVVLAEAGHFPWVDAGPAFLAAVADFLGEHE
jgi:pimeloyl-ACP methyl ester carboxylesterase